MKQQPQKMLAFLVAAGCLMVLPLVLQNFGNALVRIADMADTYNCRLAYYLRKKLHKLGVYTGVQMVFSPEEVGGDVEIMENEKIKKSRVGTISYMPTVFGCYMASAIIKGILEENF